LSEKIWTVAKEIVSELEKSKFSAIVYRNDEESGIVIIYEPLQTMTIYGLRPELPHAVCFKGEHIYGSSAGSYIIEFYEEKPKVIIEKEIKWTELDPISGLQVFWLLDPRKLLYLIKEIKTLKIHERGLRYLLGKYSIEQLKFPVNVKKWFEQHHQLHREAHFYFANGKLSRLTQTDIPPFQDNVTLVFSYSK
jgi:hypothetical protein